MERVAVHGSRIQESLSSFQRSVGHWGGPPGVRLRVRAGGCHPGEGVRVREPEVEPGQWLF